MEMTEMLDKKKVMEYLDGWCKPHFPVWICGVARTIQNDIRTGKLDVPIPDETCEWNSKVIAEVTRLINTGLVVDMSSNNFRHDGTFDISITVRPDRCVYKVSPKEEDIEFGPMGAWRSFYGQLIFDDDMKYKGLLLYTYPEYRTYPSVYGQERAVAASGWK